MSFFAPTHPQMLNLYQIWAVKREIYLPVNTSLGRLAQNVGRTTGIGNSVRTVTRSLE